MFTPFNRSVEAKTAEEINQIQTKEGLIKWLKDASPYSAIASKAFDHQRHFGLDDAHTLALMAYFALVSAEKTKEVLIDHMNVCVGTPIILRSKEEIRAMYPDGFEKH